MNSRRSDTAGVIAPPPAIYAGGAALGLLADHLLGLAPLAGPSGLLWALAGAAGLAGITCAAAALRLFRRLGTPAEPWKPTRKLARDGIYRVTRNPMYLGMALLLLAAGLALRSIGVLALLPLVVLIIDRGVIAREERYLSGLFGADYADYRAHVRRWF
jgi:protein-S-isoprenylcysteine O-methyltransferase Ste14